MNPPFFVSTNTTAVNSTSHSTRGCSCGAAAGIQQPINMESTWNIGLVEDENPISPQSWVKKSRKDQNGVYISAHKKENIDLLRAKLLKLIKVRHFQIFPNYLKSGDQD